MASRVVRFLAGNYPWPWARQTPNNDGVFGSTQYLFGPGEEPADWLVVYDELPEGYDKSWSKNRTIFVASEPINVKRYDTRFLAQFGTVLTTDHGTRHNNPIFTHLALPWHVGMQVGQAETYAQALRFSDFELGFPPKTRLCSVICSNKAFSSQHRQRLDFVKKLKASLGDRIDVYGRGFVDMADKDDALASYRYHIALENSNYMDYWTEKLADPYLRGCFPIYWGATNIGKYFPNEAIAPIDITKPEAAIATISAVLNSDTDLRSHSALMEARHRVLWEHNLFALLNRTLDSLEVALQSTDRKCVVLRREVCFPPSLRRRVIQRARRVVSNLWRNII